MNYRSNRQAANAFRRDEPDAGALDGHGQCQADHHYPFNGFGDVFDFAVAVVMENIGGFIRHFNGIIKNAGDAKGDGGDAQICRYSQRADNQKLGRFEILPGERRKKMLASMPLTERTAK